MFRKLIWWIDIISTSNEIGFRWLAQNPNDDKSTLVQVRVVSLEQKYKSRAAENDYNT